MSNDSLGEQGSALRPYREMLVTELTEGLFAYRRPWGGLLVSSISAGIDVSFSVLLVAVVHHLAEGVLAPPAVRVLAAALYPVGFIFVILGRTELFTEQTTLAVVPVLHGRASVAKLARLWGVVYAGNLLGVAVLVGVLAVIGPAKGIMTPRVFDELAGTLVGHPWWVILLSAGLVGWLFGLLSWLIAAARDTISQIVLVWLIAGAVGLGHLHHSVVGTGEVLAGVLVGHRTTLADLGHFFLWTTLGNAAGGVVFAVLLRYSEGARGQRLKSQEGRQSQD